MREATDMTVDSTTAAVESAAAAVAAAVENVTGNFDLNFQEIMVGHVGEVGPC